jgi:hypothetical protein
MNEQDLFIVIERLKEKGATPTKKLIEQEYELLKQDKLKNKRKKKK